MDFTQDLIATGSNEETSTSLKAANKGVIGAEANLIGAMPLKTQEKTFFGCKPMHAVCDADLLIVQTAIEAASQGVT